MKNEYADMDIWQKLDFSARLSQEKYGLPPDKRPMCKLVGEDGNAYAIMGRVAKTLKRAGFRKEAEEYYKFATSGDYNNLLRVSMKYVNDRYFEDEKYADAIDYLAEVDNEDNVFF